MRVRRRSAEDASSLALEPASAPRKVAGRVLCELNALLVIGLLLFLFEELTSSPPDYSCGVPPMLTAIFIPGLVSGGTLRERGDRCHPGVVVALLEHRAARPLQPGGLAQAGAHLVTGLIECARLSRLGSPAT